MKNSLFPSARVAVVSLWLVATAAGQPDSPARLQELEAKPIQGMTNVDLGEYLMLRTSIQGPGRDLSGSISDFARKAVDQPFLQGARQFSLASADCITFTERAIAVGLSSDWDTYYRLTQRLRHKDGVVQFLERNFFTPDWVTNNSWLLEDITTQLEQTEPYSHPIYRRSFYSDLHFGELADSDQGRQKAAAKQAKIASLPEVEQFQDVLIPRDRIPNVLPSLKTGDVCLIIRGKQRPDGSLVKFCDHMGIIEKVPEGEVYLLHCAPPRARRQPLRQFLRHYKVVAGLKFLRVRPDAAHIVSEELTRVSASMPVLTAEQADLAVTGAPAP